MAAISDGNCPDGSDPDSTGPDSTRLEPDKTLSDGDLPDCSRRTLSGRAPSGPVARGFTDLADLDAVFGALAHQSRRTILSVLYARGGEMTSGAIAARFDHSWPTTSAHLRVLEKAGLVSLAMRGRERVYQVDVERLQSVAGAWLDRFRADSG